MKAIDRRQFLRLVALTGGATALAACGGTGPEATTNNKQGGDKTGFQGTIEFWDWNHDPRVAFVEELVAAWEKNHSGVTLKYNPLEWTEIETKLLVAATAGSGPVFSNVHYFWRYDLQRAGALAPYPDDMFNWDDLISTPFNRDPETGKVYTSNFNWYADVLFYNRELLDAEGISEEQIPRNWDDFIKMAQQLTKANGQGKITQAGFSMNDYWAREWFWADLVYQAGGWLWNESGTEALWNSEESVAALQFIQDIYLKWKVDDPEFLEQEQAFGNGQAATYVNQGYTAGTINSMYPQMEGKWLTTVEPTLTGKPLPSWGMQVPEEGFAVFETFPEEVKALSFDFIKFALGSEERRVDWALLMDGPPDNESLLDHAKIVEQNVISSAAETLPYRICYGERPLEAEKLWRAMFDRVILEEENPRTVLDEVTAEMNKILEKSDKRRIITERSYEPPSS